MNEFEMYQDALHLCERGELARSRSVADAYFTDAIEVLEQLVQQVPNSSRFHQLLGICWYNYSQKGEERSRGIREHLERALAIKPSEQLTIAHLIYYSYEQGHYQKTLDLLRQADYGYFQQQGQGWRNLRYEELKLCCRLRLEPALVTAEEVERFFAAREELDPEHQLQLSELADCGADLGARLSESEAGRAVLGKLKQGQK